VVFQGQARAGVAQVLQAMIYKLFAMAPCTACLSCEEFLPGFISEFNGVQQVGEYWAGKLDVIVAIDRAMRHCPQMAITFEVME